MMLKNDVHMNRECIKVKTIAILTRNPEAIGEKLSIVEQLRQSASRIQVFLLGYDPSVFAGEKAAVIERCRAQDIECYTDMPGFGDLLKVERLDRKRIAELLEHADLVIPL